MKFDLISDVHVEHNRAWADHPSYDGVSSIYPWHLEKQSDILLIPGDCSNDPWTTMAVIEEAAQFYDRVLFTDGNHDHYTAHSPEKDGTERTVSMNNAVMRDVAEKIGKATFLDEHSPYQIGSTVFLGAMGWYDWTANMHLSREQQHRYWKKDSNDSRMIRFDDDGYPDKLARRQAEAFRRWIELFQGDESVEEIIMATHTIPHRRGMVADSHWWGYLNGSYMNNCMEQVWIADKADKISTWVFGHTHFHYDFDAEGIRFVNNARGYHQERYKGNAPRRVITIDSDCVGEVQYDDQRGGG